MIDAKKWFESQSRELVHLESILQMLSWDQETTMPSAGAVARAGQSSSLAALYHQKLTDSRWADLLDELDSMDLDEWSATCVREMRRKYNRATRMPESLVRELAKTTSLSYEAWVDARKKSNFSTFKPWLERILELKRQEAKCLDPLTCLYDALLEDYEPGITSADLDHLFPQLRPQITKLLKKIQESPSQPKMDLVKGHYPRASQESFGRRVLAAIGFDWKAGRLDVSPHPFCSGFAPQDVRITTRYTEDNFDSSFFGIVHEGGHALYEQGLGAERYGSLACQAISLGIHESQSRLWENQVARSRPFWEFWYPELQKTFPRPLGAVALEPFLAAVNRVKASLIRVEADEVSYGLHVILRYELEKALLHEDLPVSDLEHIWIDRMKEYLGIVPENAADGVLQDTHWSQGLIGYFPTYLLGSLYAAQIYHQAVESIPDLHKQISSGQFLDLREWLCKKIYQKGKTRTAKELIVEISGEPLNSKFLINYLHGKFSQLYEME